MNHADHVLLLQYENQMNSSKLVFIKLIIRAELLNTVILHCVLDCYCAAVCEGNYLKISIYQVNTLTLTDDVVIFHYLLTKLSN